MLNLRKPLHKPSIHIWMMTQPFCILMISLCMIEGFSPKRGILDPIKVINHDDKDKERQIIAMGLSLTNYLYILFQI